MKLFISIFLRIVSSFTDSSCTDSTFSVHFEVEKGYTYKGPGASSERPENRQRV